MKIIDKNKDKFGSVSYMGNILYKINTTGKSLFVWSAMVNGKGWLSLNIPINEKLNVIIFIDGFRLGLGFRGEDIKQVEEIMNSHGKIFYDNLRFEFSDIVKEKRRKSKTYNKFDKGKTLYRWRNINQDIKVSEVIEKISEFIDTTLNFHKNFN